MRTLLQHHFLRDSLNLKIKVFVQFCYFLDVIWILVNELFTFKNWENYPYNVSITQMRPHYNTTQPHTTTFNLNHLKSNLLPNYLLLPFLHLPPTIFGHHHHHHHHYHRSSIVMAINSYVSHTHIYPHMLFLSFSIAHKNALQLHLGEHHRSSTKIWISCIGIFCWFELILCWFRIVFNDYVTGVIYKWWGWWWRWWWK